MRSNTGAIAKAFRRIICVGATLSIVPLMFAAEVNAPAPAFVLHNSRHQKRTLADYRGDIVLINFWASWCAPCQLELPELNHLAALYGKKKLKVLAINVDRDRSRATELLAKLHLVHPHFEVLWDPRSIAVTAYNIESMPSSFILDARGVVRFRHSGFHTADPGLWRSEIDGFIKKS